MISRARNRRADRRIVFHTGVNGWNKLPGEMVEIGLVHEFKDGLNDARFSVFGDDNVPIVWLRMTVKRNAVHYFPLFKFDWNKR